MTAAVSGPKSGSPMNRPSEVSAACEPDEASAMRWTVPPTSGRPARAEGQRRETARSCGRGGHRSAPPSARRRQAAGDVRGCEAVAKASGAADGKPLESAADVDVDPDERGQHRSAEPLRRKTSHAAAEGRPAHSASARRDRAIDSAIESPAPTPAPPAAPQQPPITASTGTTANDAELPGVDTRIKLPAAPPMSPASPPPIDAAAHRAAANAAARRKRKTTR